MKKIIILLISITIFAAGCKKKEEEQKEKVKEFVEAVENNDFEKAEENSTPKTRKLLTALKKQFQKLKDKIKKPEKVEKEIGENTGDEKNPKIKVDVSIGKDKKQVHIPLVLVDGKWLIDLSDEDLSFLQFIIFRNQLQIIIKNNDKKKHTYKHTKKKSHKKSKKKKNKT